MEPMPVTYSRESVECGNGASYNWRSCASQKIGTDSRWCRDADCGTYVRWLGRHRRLKVDYECLPETTEALIHIAMIRLMASDAWPHNDLFKRPLRDRPPNGG